MSEVEHEVGFAPVESGLDVDGGFGLDLGSIRSAQVPHPPEVLNNGGTYDERHQAQH